MSRYTQHFTAVADQANWLALETAESLLRVPLRRLERSTHAAAGYSRELAHTGATLDLPSLLSKGQQLARDNFERVASTHQEMVGLSLKAGEALAELVRQPFGTSAR